MLYVTKTMRVVATNSSTLLIFLSEVADYCLYHLFGNFQENLSREDRPGWTQDAGSRVAFGKNRAGQNPAWVDCQKKRSRERLIP